MATPRQLFAKAVMLLIMCSGTQAATFTILNKCSYTVWPGLLSGAGSQQLQTTGFQLQPGESKAIPVPAPWSGRLWGRTFCKHDSASSKFACLTGDCGSSSVECSGNGAKLPVTLAEFTLNRTGGLDFFDVSLVDGYNLPLLIQPQGGNNQGNCSFTGCDADLNLACPAELQVRGNVSNVKTVVACKSACLAFGNPRYCCSGSFSTPEICKPNSYSEFFKNQCPRVYSYAYDDATSTFTCGGADYIIIFCSSNPPSSASGPQEMHPFSPSVSAGLLHSSGKFIAAVIAISQIFQLHF